MTARVEAERAIADVLAEHEHAWTFEVQMGREYSTLCCVGDCEWSIRQIKSLLVEGKAAPSDEDCYDAHRAHVASVLADLMTEKQAEAWDEGAVYGHAPDEFMDYDANPYRPDPKDTRDE